MENISISNKGFYTNYSVELNLSLLQVNAILKSDILTNMEAGYSAISMDYKYYLLKLIC
jgi:hypothetical protein